MSLRILIFLAIVILAEYYSFVVVRGAVRSLPPAWRNGLLVFYILMTLLTWAGLLFFRRIDWGSLPPMVRNIYVAFTMGFVIGKILVLVVMLGDEIRRIVQWGFSKFKAAPPAGDAGSYITRSVFLQRMALLLGAGAVGGFLYGITNRYNYSVRRVKIAFKELPEAFRGLKIVQISDIHSGSFDNTEAVARGVQKVLDEKPDIVFFTGDLVNNKADEVGDYQEVFARIKAPMGVYSTLGNHDYGDYARWPSAQAKIANLDKLKGIHAAMGWRLLMNEHVVLERGADKIAVLGIENWGAKAGFPKYGDMAAAYAGLPEKNIPFKILLSHDPSHWDAQVRKQYPDVQLTLSGHTHGMQFGVEIPGLKWSPVQYVYEKWAGLYQEAAQYLYVNRGFGFLGYPGRLGILAEITVIELV